MAAPLLYVSATQINLVTPRALQGKTTTQVCTTANHAPTNCLGVPVQPVTPEIFLSSGLYAAALNEDGTINSAGNPAPVGSIVSVFATGLGAITTLPDGAITPWPPSQYPGVQMQATAYLVSKIASTPDFLSSSSKASLVCSILMPSSRGQPRPENASTTLSRPDCSKRAATATAPAA